MSKEALERLRNKANKQVSEYQHRADDTACYERRLEDKGATRAMRMMARWIELEIKRCSKR